MEEFVLTDLLERLHLSEEAKDCALDVYKITVKTMSLLQDKDKLPPRPENYRPESRVRRSSDKIEVSRKNVMRLIDLLRRYDSICAEFKKNFPLWEHARRKNIAYLDKRVKSLNKDHKICNAVSVASNSVAAAGTLTVLGTILFPPGAASIDPISVGGMVAAGVGGATSLASSIADVSRLKKHIKKAKKICREDKSNFELLGEWISHTKELEEAMANLIGFKVWMKMWETLKDYKKERDSLSARSSAFVKAIIKCVSYAFEGENLYLEWGIKASAAILTTVIAMILFHHRTRSALQICKLGLGILGGVEAGIEITKLVTVAATGAGSAAATLVPGGVNPDIAYGALAGVGLALEVTMVVLGSIELAKGKTCKEGKQIMKLSKMLEEERKVLRDVYEAIP